VEKRYLAVILIAAASLAAVGVTVYALLSAPKIEIQDSFFRRGTTSTGVFFIARNRGLFEGCIMAGEVVGAPNLRIEIHKTEVHEGKAIMTPVSKICIPGGGEVKALGIEGEGYHLMILGKLPEDVKKVKIRLYIDNGSILEFEAMEQELEVSGSEHHHEG